MAAAVKALNAKIRSNPVADYVCSTHFWGPRSPDVISGPMTFALCGYSGVFMRYAMAVTPRNCVNFSAQATQGYRYVNYWHMGGRETAAKEGQAPEMAGVVGDKAKEVGSQVKEGAQEVKGKVEEQVEKIRK